MKRQDRDAPPGEPSVHLAELAQFTRQTGAMLQAQVDILRAIDVASRQTGHPRLVYVGGEMAGLLANGLSFAEAAARFPDVFSPFYLQMTRQGDADGVLGAALVSLADYMDQELRQGPGTVGASSVAATGLVAALLGTVGAAILGAGGLLAAGLSLDWGAWTTPASLAWSGFMLLVGAGWLAWRASRGPSFCVTCGRPLPPAAGWKAGPRMCDTCVRREVGRLKPAARRPVPSDNGGGDPGSLPPLGSESPVSDLPGVTEADPFASSAEGPGRPLQL
jgi:hypothetical protein